MMRDRSGDGKWSQLYFCRSKSSELYRESSWLYHSQKTTNIETYDRYVSLEIPNAEKSQSWCCFCKRHKDIWDLQKYWDIMLFYISCLLICRDGFCIMDI